MEIDLRMWAFPPRVFAKQFKDINPLGTIPAWEEDGHLLTESAAICQRIAAGTDLEVRPDEPDYLPYLNWMHRSDATLTFPLTIVLRYTRLEPEERKLPQAVEDYKGFFMGRAKSIEEALSDGREWLTAGRFTAADINNSFVLEAARARGRLATLPNLARVLAAWQARPAYLRALAKGGAYAFGPTAAS